MAAASRRLIDGFVTSAPSKDREEEKAKARAKWEKRAARIAAGAG